MPVNDLQAELKVYLAERAGVGLLRRLRCVTARAGAACTMEGCACVNFASNDYLGFAGDAVTREGALHAVRDWGSGAGAARLISGDYALIRELEELLAAWKGAEAALVFPSGYMANLGVITALAGPDDTVVLDRLAHASLIDGARLSRAAVRVFPHNDVERLEELLRRRPKGRVLVATEAVFSMDGDCAPLAELVACCRRHGAIVLVDEAHALGVYGNGRGCVAEAGLTDAVDIVVGTLSKALGSQGGFVSGSRELIETLVNRARAFVYTTGLAPAAAGAAKTAVEELMRSTARVQRLWENVRRWRSALAEVPVRGSGPIGPVMTGSAAAAVALAGRLKAAGYYAPAIRPPTVPRGAARVRVTLSAVHTPAQLDGMAAALRRAQAEIVNENNAMDRHD